MVLTLTSTAFHNRGAIPMRYTGDDQDISPELSWKGAPEATKAYALIMDDPDAPMGTWVHWVLYNIPATTHSLDEAIAAADVLDNGAKQGVNDFRRIGYGGPMPPPGRPHRYFFKLYALDRLLDLPPRATKAEVEKAMRGHILAEAQLMGLYAR